MARLVPTYDLYGEDPRTDDVFDIHCETIASRSSTYHWEIGLHRHERVLQFLYIWDGSGDAMLDGEVTHLHPPCVVFVPPGPVHGFRFSRDIAGVVITSTVAAADTLLATRAAQVIQLEAHAADTIYIDQTFHRVAQEYDAARHGRKAMLDAYLAVITALLRRRAGEADNVRSMDSAQQHVAAFSALIAGHFRQQMTVTDYATRLGLSPTHLNRLCRKVTGMSAHDLIITRKIDEARRALSLTGASIQQVSENLGFSDATYFSRCFRLRVGSSPRDYRQAQRTQSVKDM